MKKFLLRVSDVAGALVCVVLFLSVSALKAQKPYSLKSAKVTIEGTSSVHDWTEDVTIVAWVGQLTVENNQVKDIKNVTLKMPVTSIKSTKGSVMDTKTYEAFNYKKNPDITYKLSSVFFNAGVITVSGPLMMNGDTKIITMKITAKVLPNGDVQFIGSHVINMKDYQMKPPTAVMGTIKVGEIVTIKFNLIVSPSK